MYNLEWLYLPHLEEGDLIEDTSTATPHLTTKSPSSTISINQTASIPGANLTILKSTILVNQTASIPGGNLTNLKSTILVNQTTNIITPVLTSTNTVRGSRALGNIYILIGVGIAILLMLGITITALVLCTWQCKKIKGKHYCLFESF